MTICIAGKNEIAVQALFFILENGIKKEHILVIPNKTDTGQHGWQPSLKKICETHQIKLCTLSDVYHIEDLIFISLEFDQIIDVKKFKSQSLYNIHFSLLPSYKGMFTSVMPILNNEKKSGVTLHLIDNGIDTGEIVDQIEFPIPAEANAFDLYRLYLKNGQKLFRRNWKKILEGSILSSPQSAIGSSYYSKKTLDFKNININLNKTAQEIHNQIRGYAFRPYQLPKVGGIPISHSWITSDRSNNKPGCLLFEDDFSIRYSTIDYDILLYKDRLDDILKAAEQDDLPFIINCYKRHYKLYEKNEKGWDALIVATQFENWETFKFLIENGFEPDVVDNNGISALMYAVTSATKSNRLEFMNLLIYKGAQISYRDYDGISIMEFAMKSGNENVIEFLRRSF